MNKGKDTRTVFLFLVTGFEFNYIYFHVAQGFFSIF